MVVLGMLQGRAMGGGNPGYPANHRLLAKSPFGRLCDSIWHTPVAQVVGAIARVRGNGYCEGNGQFYVHSNDLVRAVPEKSVIPPGRHFY